MTNLDSERFWDEKARENALYYVDNRLDYGSPDDAAFWSGGPDVLDRVLGMVGITVAPDDEVLDIGCGVGRLTRVFAQRARKAYGLDVSSEMLKLAREHNAGIDNIEWLHGDGRSLSVLGDDTVDGCFSHVVFQHIPDPAITLDYIRDMGRVLRPGGWAVFQISMDPTVHQPPRPGPRERVMSLLGRGQERTDGAWWGSAVDGDGLRAAARDGGLQIERLLDEGTQFATVLARAESSSA
jgi:SAM-dependent methyltransferase